MREATRVIREFAELHHGFVARDGIRSRGITKEHVRAELLAGRLERVTDNVLHLVGAPRTTEGVCMAGWLDVGPRCVLAGDAGGWAWRLRGFRPPTAPEFVRQRGTSNRLSEIAVVRDVRYPPEAFSVALHGVPVLTLPALLYQLAGRLPPVLTARLVDDVWARSAVLLNALHDLLDVLPQRGRNGITVMRAILDERPRVLTPGPTRLERRFESILRDGGIEPPKRQVDVGGQVWLGRVDYRDPRTGALFEVDSEEYHTSLGDRLRDEARDKEMLEAGFPSVTRIFEEEIWHDRFAVLWKYRETMRLLAAGHRRFVMRMAGQNPQFY